MPPTECAFCSSPLPPRQPGPGRHRRFCSSACQQRARLRRFVPRGEDRPGGACEQCAAPVSPPSRGPVPRYCSGRCRHEAYSGGAPRTQWVRARRAEIFERDGWRCGICEQPIDPAAEYPDLAAATIDHIKRLADGGTDSAENVQSAHFLCNIQKRELIETR